MNTDKEGGDQNNSDHPRNRVFMPSQRFQALVPALVSARYQKRQIFYESPNFQSLIDRSDDPEART
eukprot:768208-Hanusia_phi.AAC.8